MTTATESKPRDKTYINIKGTANGPKYEPTKYASDRLDWAKEVLDQLQVVLPTKMAELAHEARLKLIQLQEAMTLGRVEEKQPE